MMRSLVPVLSAALLASVGLVGCKKNSPAPEAKEPAASAKKDHDDEPEGHDELPTSVRLPAEVLASAGIRTAVVTKKPLPATVDLTGEVVADPDHVTKVAARVPGRIVEVRFKEGERVKAGAVLAVIESAELARMRATFAASQARGQSAQKNAERLGSLAKTGLAAGQEVAGANAEARALQAEAAAAQRTLQSFGLPMSELSQAGSRLELRARIEGFIVSRNAIVDQSVTAEHVLGEIVNLDRAYFLGRLFEKNLELVKAGATAEVRLNAYSKKVFIGKVESIGKQLDPIVRTVVARITLENRDDLLKVGLFGTARVNSGEAEPEESTLVVPLTAVTHIGERDVVFVRHPDGDFEVHPVTLGRTAAGQVQILSGVRAGEQVVVEGIFTLKSAVLKSTFGEED
ncbi:MAG: efflux RND transporter periplasmic adaptor subunit [Polyangia bacterium]